MDNDCQEGLAIETVASLNGSDVLRVVQRIALERQAHPVRIQADNAPKFISLARDKWTYETGLTLDFSQPRKPTDNAFIESFNGSVRDECLNTNWFMSFTDARKKLKNWRQDYTHFRPRSSLADTAPTVFAR